MPSQPKVVCPRRPVNKNKHIMPRFRRRCWVLPVPFSNFVSRELSLKSLFYTTLTHATSCNKRLTMLSTALILAAFTASCVLAQNTNPACIKDCTSRLAISSHCDGGETGAALDRCTCTTWLGGSASPLVTCIKACPTADQSVFVSKIPELCRGDLFPGVTASSATTSTGTPSSTGPNQSSPTTNGSTTSPNAGIAFRAPSVFAVGGLMLALLL